MESSEQAVLKEAVKTNPELRRLYNKHLAIKEKLSRFSSRLYLTPNEEMQQRRLKGLKLKAKEDMMLMVQQMAT